MVDRSLDPIEKAIRSAFEKGDPGQRAFREKVYRSAFTAMERALQANPNVTEAIAQRRRETLSAKITEIESEFLPAVPAVEPVRPAQQRQAPQGAVPQASAPDPAFAPVVTSADRADTAFAGDGFRDAVEPPARGERATRSRRGWLTPLVSLLVLVALIGGVWWWLGSSGQSGAQQPASPRVADEPSSAPSEPPPMLGGADDLTGWITVFDPADPTTVAAPGDSQAQVTEEDGQSFIRIRSGASGTPVVFDVGQGILEEVAGRRAVFAIVARSSDGETQISVECSLAELGDCGRRRFPVGVTRDEFLFEVEVPAGNPASGGVIAINPDVENEGRPVDIYAIRVSPAPAG